MKNHLNEQHVWWLRLAEYPTLQLMQTADEVPPDVVEYVPATQLKHTLDDVAPTVVE